MASPIRKSNRILRRPERPGRFLRLGPIGTGLAVLAAAFLAPGTVPRVSAERWPCPLLDAPHRSWRDVDLAYVFPAEAAQAGWEDTGVVETRLRGMLVYWESRWGSDLEVRGEGDILTLSGFEGTSSSYSLVMARAVVQWSQRFPYGWGVRLDAAPGLYAALRETGADGWAVPFGLSVVHNVSPVFAIQAGALVLPGFDQPVDPRLGFHWKTKDRLRIDLAYPESGVSLRLFEPFRVFAGARFWNWQEFNMGKDARGSLRYTEARTWAGAELRLGESLGVTTEAGYVFARRLRFESGGEIELADAPFIRLGLTWLF